MGAEEGKVMKRLLLVINTVILTLGATGGPMVLRLYFIHGGKRVWLSSALETAAFPVLLIPLAISYFHRRRNNPHEPTKLFFIQPRLLLAAVIIGVLTGLDDYFYAYGVARLPVSTSALIIASQLAFTATFAYFLVKQKFTAYSFNAVVLMTIGAAVLALHSSADRPAGESSKEYVVGFLMTVAAAILYGFVLPFVELSYKLSKQNITYTLVMEMQFVISVSATVFCVIGMLVNHDFQVIGREASEYGLGKTMYYVVLFFSSITWQAFFLGAVGVIFCSSSLLSGIMIALLLPITEVLAVIFYKERFSAEKGLSLVLSIWGFVSYFYGEFKQMRKTRKSNALPETHTQLTPLQNP